MDYEKKYKEALERARLSRLQLLDIGEEATEIEYIFPELAESEDEKIRKELITHCRNTRCVTEEVAERIAKWIAWLENIPYTIDHEKREGFHLGYKAGLEKQGETFTKKDVDDAYIEGMAFAKDELKKQSEQKPIDKIDSFDKYEGLTDFERTLADICIGWIGQELGWKQYIKDNADVLLKIAVEKFNSVQDVPFEQKPAELNEDNNSIISDLLDYFDEDKCLKHEVNDIVKWLKTIKPQQKGWGEEDQNALEDVREAVVHYWGGDTQDILLYWLKSLKQGIGGEQ